MFNEKGQIAGVGSVAPGEEHLAIERAEEVGANEMALVTVYASIPSLGHVTSSFVRVNLFSDLSGTRQHLASAICPAGTSGAVISATGHCADSYHVTLQATNPKQCDIKLGLAVLGCCAEPKVRVRPDLLSLVFAAAELGLGPLQWTPMVPWGGEFGAPKVYTVDGTSSLAFPDGARLTHWQALGTGAGGTVTFNGLSNGVPINVGNALPAREGFPEAQLVTSVGFTNLVFGLFEIVV